MYTIEEWKEGKCLMLNDGSLDELNKVLTHVYPNTDVSSGSCKYYVSIGTDWRPLTNVEVPNLPTQSVKDFINQIKKMKTITWQQAQQIIEIACFEWKSSLCEKWQREIALKTKSIYVSEEFYQKMRAACTKEQHKLFDEIFGKDVQVCPFKDGEPIWVRDCDNEYWLFRYSNGEIGENGYYQAYNMQRKKGTVSYWKYAIKFDPNNLPLNE